MLKVAAKRAVETTKNNTYNLCIANVCVVHNYTSHNRSSRLQNLTLTKGIEMFSVYII